MHFSPPLLGFDSEDWPVIFGNPEVIPRNVGEERALPPQSNSVKTFVIARAAPVPGSSKRLKICQFGWLRGTEKLLK
jgi:hypothetical protein